MKFIDYFLQYFHCMKSIQRMNAYERKKIISEIDSGRRYPIYFDVDCIPYHLEMFWPRMEFPNKEHNPDWEEGLL